MPRQVAQATAASAGSSSARAYIPRILVMLASSAFAEDGTE
jgi:hypothetical protein